MRSGRLLAETSPSSLIQHFALPSLEDIFLKLCLQDGDEDDPREAKVSISSLHGHTCLTSSKCSVCAQ